MLGLRPSSGTLVVPAGTCLPMLKPRPSCASNTTNETVPPDGSDQLITIVPPLSSSLRLVGGGLELSLTEPVGAGRPVGPVLADALASVPGVGAGCCPLRQRTSPTAAAIASTTSAATAATSVNRLRTPSSTSCAPPPLPPPSHAGC